MLSLAAVLLAALLPPEGAAIHPLREKIDAFLARQRLGPRVRPTGLTPRDYLRTIDAQIAAMRKYQDAAGRVIDPVIHQEFAFATPCYAHAASVLSASGLRSDPALLRSAMLAIDAAVSDMAAGKAPNGHGDFAGAARRIGHRNGMVEPYFAETARGPIVCRIQAR